MRGSTTTHHAPRKAPCLRHYWMSGVRCWMLDVSVPPVCRRIERDELASARSRTLPLRWAEGRGEGELGSRRFLGARNSSMTPSRPGANS